MYARQVKGRTLTLGVSGLLWDGSLVLIDQETESLWSHLLGEAMRGPLQGETLETIPALMTEWKNWVSHYPQTTAVLMPRTAIDYRRDIHNNEGLLIGLADRKHAKGWDLELLKSEPVINDTLGDRDLLIVYDRSSGTAVIFDRRVSDRTLSFERRDGKVFDRETGSEWDPMTGIAKTSPLEGKRLVQLPGIISYHPPWYAFHPNTTVLGLDDRRSSRSNSP